MTNITDKLKIQIILVSIRKGRQGEKVAKWIYNLAQQNNDMEVELLDLKDWQMPYYAEAITPDEINGNYESEMVRNWVKKINGAHGYIVVTPEYNHGYPALLKTALDCAYNEWNNKPIAFVSYSNGSASGIRAVEQLRQVAIALQMAPIYKSVGIPRVQENINEDGTPNNPKLNKTAEGMFTQLVWWGRTLRFGRNELE